MSRIFDNLRNVLELGGPVVALILVLGFVAIFIIITKLIWQLRNKIGRTHMLDRLLEKLDAGEDISKDALPQEGLMPKIVRESLGTKEKASRLGLSPQEARERSVIDAERALAGLDWGNRSLELIAQIAPLLGLFGTVLGMIDAFQALEASGQSVDPSKLAQGIWVALLTTAAGLALAMPVSIALNYFEARRDQVRKDADYILEIIFRPGLKAQSDHAPR